MREAEAPGLLFSLSGLHHRQTENWAASQSIFSVGRESMDFRNVSQSRLLILGAIFVLMVLGATGLWAQTTDVNYKGFTAYEEARASTGDRSEERRVGKE